MTTRQLLLRSLKVAAPYAGVLLGVAVGAGVILAAFGFVDVSVRFR